MKLNINQPAYFKDEYGIDNDVYRYCQKLFNYFADKEYSKTLSVIGIVPIAAPKSLYEKGYWQENVQIFCNGKCASVFVRIDFESYFYANSNEKTEIIKQAILKAVKQVAAMGEFDYNSFAEALNEVEI